MAFLFQLGCFECESKVQKSIRKRKLDVLVSLACYWTVGYLKIPAFLQYLLKYKESTGTEMHSLTGI